MTSFAEHWTGRAKSLAVFGDSVTQAIHIPIPEHRWSNRLAERLRARLSNRGISGTVLQSSPDASGRPRADNGHTRYVQDLLGTDRADVIAILYGTNDARYTAAPATFSLEAFTRDYRAVLTGLFAAGYSPDAIVIGSPPYLPEEGFAVGAEDGFAGQSRRQFQLYVETVKSIATEAGTFYAPVSERMATEGGDALIGDDHVHPNEAGHARIAEIFAAATRPVTP